MHQGNYGFLKRAFRLPMIYNFGSSYFEDDMIAVFGAISLLRDIMDVMVLVVGVFQLFNIQSFTCGFGLVCCRFMKSSKSGDRCLWPLFGAV